MAVKVSRKGDVIELGAGAAFRLEQAVLVADDGQSARRPDEGEEAPARPWKLYRRVENETVEKEGKPTLVGADGEPTTYTYRYDAMAEFMADDEAAAVDEAQRIISAEG